MKCGIKIIITFILLCLVFTGITQYNVKKKGLKFTMPNSITTVEVEGNNANVVYSYNENNFLNDVSKLEVTVGGVETTFPVRAKDSSLYVVDSSVLDSGKGITQSGVVKGIPYDIWVTNHVEGSLNADMCILDVLSLYLNAIDYGTVNGEVEVTVNGNTITTNTKLIDVEDILGTPNDKFFSESSVLYKYSNPMITVELIASSVGSKVTSITLGALENQFVQHDLRSKYYDGLIDSKVEGE